jgi:predicted dithiol-disulfide oxidoreductase (DUF899 family)
MRSHPSSPSRLDRGAAALLSEEKELTRLRAGSRRTAARSQVKIETLCLRWPDGKVSLADLFDRGPVRVKHFMMAPGTTTQFSVYRGRPR